MQSILFAASVLAPLARIALTPTWIAIYVFFGALIYLMVALALDLPLPGATRGPAPDDIPLSDPDRDRPAPRSPRKRGGGTR